MRRRLSFGRARPPAQAPVVRVTTAVTEVTVQVGTNSMGQVYAAAPRHPERRSHAARKQGAGAPGEDELLPEPLLPASWPRLRDPRASRGGVATCHGPDQPCDDRKGEQDESHPE